MRRLHRSVGAAAAIFVLFMVLTGIVINLVLAFMFDSKLLILD